MSAECSAWAVRVRIRQSSVKNLLMVIADLANHVTGEVFASLGYLEDATGLSKKTVLGGIEALVEMGILERTDERKGRTGQIPVYIFEMAEGVEVIPKGGRSKRVAKSTPLENRGKNDQERGDILPPKEGQKRHTEPRRGNQVDKPDTPPLPSEEPTPHDTDNDLFLTGTAIEVRAPSLHEAVLTAWKAMSQQVPAIANIRGMEDSRKRAITARGRDAVACGAESAIAGWSEVFAAVGRSSFLRGEAAPGKGRQTSFRLTLDFVLKPTNFRKILEGGYDDRHDARTSDPATGRHYGPAEQGGRAALPEFLTRFEERRGRGQIGGSNSR